MSKFRLRLLQCRRLAAGEACRGLAVLLALALLAGCVSRQPTPLPAATLAQGDFGILRTQVQRKQIDDRKNRAYLLDRARVGILALADGYAESAVYAFEEVYDVLRTQGLNEGKQVVAVAINEDLKIWKGEPFEQAVTLAYIAMANASIGSWDNARAAAGNALFYLQDFGKDDNGQSLSPEELTVASAAHDADPQRGVDLDHGYVVEPSDFTLGYLLHAIASQQLDRTDEAADYFRQAVRLEPALAQDVAQLAQGQFNAVFVVSYGVGPRKVGIGPDNAIASFSPRTASDRQPLQARLNGGTWSNHPLVTDLNRMARDHRWNNLEDVRLAKSAVGSGLLVGGLIAADYGLGSRNGDVAAIGAGIALVGAILKAGAHADTRFNDALPQRYYVVPLQLNPGLNTIELQLPGIHSARLVLKDVPAPPDRGAASVALLHYVRLPGGAYQRQPPTWATAGRIRYGNPTTGATSASPLPFVMGGDDARPPSDKALDDYQAGGNLTDYTLIELENYYRDRGIVWTREDQGGIAGRHVLEGGNSLVAPEPGTTGFMRLFGGAAPAAP